ncbi:MAG: hypothetical protein M1135_03800 [Candidatus Omnitrophica bacterium]|jgi:hypothetical protein|nr:hypothetical protein [Candidatus Omnitrophota bacterium]
MIDKDKINKPECIYRGAPFWAWNGKLDPKELRRQIRLMNKMGLGGFFMHSRVGLDTPYLSEEWFECINACADEAKKLGMYAYLYDEDRWPSGAAGGLVTKNPKYRMKHIVMKIFKDVKNIKWDKNILAAFVAKLNLDKYSAYEVQKMPSGKKIKSISPDETILIFYLETTKLNDWYNGYTYLDTINPEAVKEFINVTHNAYKKNSGKYFGSVIPGIFTDEPNYGGHFYHSVWPPQPEMNIAITWTDNLSKIFYKRYGYDIIEHLPEIYFDIEGQEISKARYHYYDCITHLFVTAFAKQIGDWCEKNNIMFTGHILAEDTLSSQTSVVGNCLRFYEHMQAPGMDLLTEYWRIFNVAKQVSSVARQFGRKWRLTETYGCTGWDFPLAGHKALGDWQFALGINLRCPHLSYYTMLGEAKRDYPASIFYQSTWWQQYPVIEDYFGRINSVMTKGEEIRDLLVIHPIESMWTIFHMGKWLEDKNQWEKNPRVKQYDEMFVNICDNLLSHHIDFDYGDEEMISRIAKITQKDGIPILKIGKAEYKSVLVPSLITIRKTTLKILDKFSKAGGQVVFVEPIAEYVDVVKSQEAKEFASNCESVSSFEEAIGKIESKTRRISISDKQGKEIKPVLYLLREDKEAFYLFVCNTSMEWNKDIMNERIMVKDRILSFSDVVIKGFPGWSLPAIEVDLKTGQLYNADCEKTDTGYQIKTEFGPIESRLFIIPRQSNSISFLGIKKKDKFQEIDRININNENWNILLSEPNVYVLDKPSYKIGEKDWQPEKEILRVDTDIRQYLGISPRGGTMVQPWARKKNKNPKTVNVFLKYSIFIEKIPSGEISFAIERPELFSISINDHKIPNDMESGWWVDKSLKTLRIDPSILKTGRNEIILETSYNENHSGFEIAYILGNFGTKIKDNQIVITEPVNSLKIGDWTEQGLLFYSGSVDYTCLIKPEIKDNQHIIVNIPEYRGSAIRILIDGKEIQIIGWPPYQTDITDYIKGKESVLLSIEVLGHRRNSHGPFHLSEKWPLWTGPGEFVAEGERWSENYQIVPCGLMKQPQIIRKEKIT